MCASESVLFLLLLNCLWPYTDIVLLDQRVRNCDLSYRGPQTHQRNSFFLRAERTTFRETPHQSHREQPVGPLQRRQRCCSGSAASASATPEPGHRRCFHGDENGSATAEKGSDSCGILERRPCAECNL